MAGVLAANISRPWHKAYSRSEKLWHRNGGDWRIGHARKDQEAQEIGQSASFIPRPVTLGAMGTGVKHLMHAGIVNATGILEGTISKNRTLIDRAPDCRKGWSVYLVCFVHLVSFVQPSN